MITRLLLFAILGISAQAHATELIQPWYSARALGMGNAFTAVVDDASSLVYNPAGLDKIRNLHVTLIGLNAGTDNFNVSSTATNITGNNFATLIEQYYGQDLWASLNIMTSVSAEDFGAGVYSNTYANFFLENSAYPSATVTLNEDLAAVGGFAVGVGPDDMFRMGFVGKRITRLGGTTTLTPAILATLNNQQITNLINSYGTGYGLDTGVILELPSTTHPAFSFVWHDIGQTAFSLQSGTNPLKPIDNDYTAGFSMRIEGAGFTVRPAFDFTNINLYSEQIGKRIHAGAEVQFSLLSIRGGVNQGYLAFGAGIKFKALAFDAAMYGEELGTFPGQTEDTRYLASMTIDLEFENGFSINGKNSGPVRKAYERR